MNLTLNLTPGISPTAWPLRPKPATSTSSFSSIWFRQPSRGTKAVTFLPFLINCTRTHLRIAELGCLASTPLLKQNCYWISVKICVCSILQLFWKKNDLSMTQKHLNTMPYVGWQWAWSLPLFDSAHVLHETEYTMADPYIYTSPNYRLHH